MNLTAAWHPEKEAQQKNSLKDPVVAQLVKHSYTDNMVKGLNLAVA